MPTGSGADICPGDAGPYLNSRAASLDYSTLRWLVYELTKNFRSDIETHIPGAHSLNLGFQEGRGLDRLLQGPLAGSITRFLPSGRCIWISRHGQSMTGTRPNGRSRPS